MSFKYGEREEVQQHRENLFQRLNLAPADALPISMGLEYGMHWFDGLPAATGVDVQGVPTEGLWTTDTSKALFLFVADCFPIAFVDPVRRAFGIFHAGRAELQSGLLDQFLRIGLEHGVRADQLRVALGPGVCARHYAFRELPSGNTLPYRTMSGSSRIDLGGFIQGILTTIGVSREHLSQDERCTYETPQLFSHRRAQGSGEGRFAFLVQYA